MGANAISHPQTQPDALTFRTAATWWGRPGRLDAVLPRSNRVLTLWRILHARFQPIPGRESRQVEEFHESSHSRRRTCRGPMPLVSLRGGCSAALWAVPRVPGCCCLASRDRTGEEPRRSRLETCRNPESPALRTGDVAASDHRQGSGELMLTALILVVFAVVVLV